MGRSLIEHKSAIQYLQKGEYYGQHDFAQDPRGNIYDFLTRLDTLPRNERIPTEAVVFALGVSAAFRKPFALLTHEPVVSVAEKLEILHAQRDSIAVQLHSSETPELLKTVTLGMVYKVGERKPNVAMARVTKHVLVVGMGDFHIDNPMKDEISKALGMKKKPERTHINPESFDVASSINLVPGIVGPFFEWKGEVIGLDKIVYFPEVRKEASFVAIAVSPTDTLVVTKDMFGATVLHWMERGYYRLLQRSTLNRAA